MANLGLKPLVIYGLKHAPDNDAPQRRFIIFNCIIPGTLVPMQSEIYYVHKFGPAGYELCGHWERQAKAAGEKVYELARALQRTEGLYWLYILPSGFVAKGEQRLADHAPAIIPKMRQALEDAFGEIDFNEVPGRDLWLPSIKSTELAKDVGVLLPP